VLLREPRNRKGGRKFVKGRVVESPRSDLTKTYQTQATQRGKVHSTKGMLWGARGKKEKPETRVSPLFGKVISEAKGAI